MVTQREQTIATSWKNIMGRVSDFESLTPQHIYVCKLVKYVCLSCFIYETKYSRIDQVKFVEDSL